MSREQNEPRLPVLVDAAAQKSGTQLRALQALFERFTLTRSEAKTLVAVMRLGRCTVPQLSPLTGIGSTNIYPVLESLAHQQLIRKVPASCAIWVALSPEQVIDRLRERERQRLEQAEAALVEVRSAIEALPNAKKRASEAFQIIDGAILAVRYGQAISSARHELLVFNRGPDVGEPEVDDTVGAAVARGVQARALWQAGDLAGAPAGAKHRLATHYALVGVDTRVASELPVALAVIDGALSLLAVPADVADETADVTYLVIENQTFARMMTRLFNQYWDEASPLGLPVASATS